MPIFEVEWQAQGVSSVEADDQPEAERLVRDAVGDLNPEQLEEFDVTNIDINDVSEL